MALDALIAVTILCWGVWGIFDKLALRKASHQEVLLILYFLFLAQIPIVAPLINWATPGWQIAPAVWMWTGLAALAYTTAAVAYLYALSKTEASYVLGITAGYPLILQFIAVAMLGESLVMNRLLGSALIGIGVFAIGASADRTTEPTTRRQRLEMLAGVILATVCWGIWGIFDKKAVEIAHPIQVYFVQCLWDAPYLLLLWWLFKRQGYRLNLANAPAWKFCALSAFSLMIGGLSYLFALSLSTASYVIVITGCYPLLMYLFALLLLKEPFNRVRLSGIALVVAGGILVQLTKNL